MKVADFMSKKVISVAKTTPLPQIWELLSQKHVHGLPIVDKQKKLVGIISSEDMLTKLFPEVEDPDDLFNDTDAEIERKLAKLKTMTAGAIMNKRVIYTRTYSNVMRALSRMIVRNVRQLPVVDEENLVVGIISKADIFKRLFRR